MIEGQLLAAEIERILDRDEVRRLEDGPLGGTPIYLGEEHHGEIVDCPLPSDGPWPVVGISDPALAQVAWQLERSALLLPGEPGTGAHGIPIAQIGDFASPGFSDMEIIGDQPNGMPQGPFSLIRPATASAPTYPMLWAHNTRFERQIIVNTDAEGRIKRVTEAHTRAIEERAQKERERRQGHGRLPSMGQRIEEAEARLHDDAARVWATATRAHYNRDVQFNANSLIVAMTERPAIGGRAWPSVILGDPEHEYAFALWCNSTPGLLLHWWTANKTQAGRGTTTVTAIPRIPALDVRALTPAQHEAAREAFGALRGERFLPFDQIDEDPARAELDRRLLAGVLGLPPALCGEDGPLALLRRKLAAEPQIHGGKRTRVVFEGGGERTERRPPR